MHPASVAGLCCWPQVDQRGTGKSQPSVRDGFQHMQVQHPHPNLFLVSGPKQNIITPL